MARDPKFEFVIGDNQEDWPTLSASLANQLFLENADFKLKADRKVLFGGNGQISAVGDLSFLTAETSTVPALTIFANGNIGVTTNLEVNGKASIGKDVNETNLTVIGTVSATKFEGDGSGLKNVGIASQWVGDKDKISFEGNVGIGTEAAEAKLQVAGNLKLQQGNSVNEFVSDLESVQGDGNTSVPTVAALNKVVNELKEQFKKISDQSEAVKKESEEVKKESAAVKQELISVKQELTSAKQEIESLQNNIKSLQTQNQSLQNQIQSLSSQLEKAEAELNAATRPTAFRGVVLVNNSNKLLALKPGNYDVDVLNGSGIGNDSLVSIFVASKTGFTIYENSGFSGRKYEMPGIDTVQWWNSLKFNDVNIIPLTSSIQVWAA